MIQTKMKPKSRPKPAATRSSSSLINRSKLLMLSDSETTDDECLMNKSVKYLRISRKNSNNGKIVFKGKRKRNSTSENLHLTSSSLANAAFSELFLQCPSTSRAATTSMEVDPLHHASSSSESTSSDLSDTCPTENNFDGDDEQSDFCEFDPQSSSRDVDNNKVTCNNNHSHPRKSRRYHHQHYHARAKTEFKIPHLRPFNPFATATIDGSKSGSPVSSAALLGTAIWKKRKPDQLS